MNHFSKILKTTLFSVVLLLIVLGCAPQAPIDETPQVDEPIIDEPIIKEPILRHAFNGSEIEAEQTYQAFGIIISNSKEARPHTNLQQADIVYEVTMEGWSVTRFLAIYASSFPDKVGPTRSARIPFAELMREHHLPFAHFGSAQTGLGDALSVLRSLSLPIRFDGVRGLNDEFFFRDSARRAPHNAYFNAQSALRKIPAIEYAPRFLFADESSVDDHIVSEIRLHYSSYNSLSYTFNPQTRSYLRSINDQPMMDLGSNEHIQVRNIIIQHAPHRDVESIRYVLVDFVGEGKAEFLVNGKHEVGRWSKESGTALTRFFDSNGEEVVLLPGNTWIQVVHPGVRITHNP